VYVVVPVESKHYLFRCVFQSHIRSAVTQHFRYGLGSYMLCKLMNT